VRNAVPSRTIKVAISKKKNCITTNQRQYCSEVHSHCLALELGQLEPINKLVKGHRSAAIGVQICEALLERARRYAVLGKVVKAAPELGFCKHAASVLVPETEVGDDLLEMLLLLFIQAQLLKARAVTPPLLKFVVLDLSVT